MIIFGICFIFLIFSYFLILYLFMIYSNKKEKVNNIISFAALFFIFIHILIILILMFQDVSFHFDLIPLWLSTLALPILILIFIVLLSSLVGYLYKSGKLRDTYKKKLKEKSDARKDLYRKIPHILIFIGILFLWLIGSYIIYSGTGSLDGMIPSENNTLYLYLQVLTTPNIIHDVLFSLGWFFYLLFFFFYIFTLIMLVNEYTRKSHYFSFPFNFICNIFLNEEERQGYGTYLYFAVGHMFAAFTCPPMVFFSILGTSSIADLVASQIGIRYGKNRISFNKKKTWEGAIAGFLASFILSFIFIGFIWSIIFSIAFTLFDVLTNKPLDASDNLIIPIGLSVLYFLIRFLFNLNYFTLIIGA